MALWSFLIGIRRLARVQDASTSTRAVQIPERRGDKTHQDQNIHFQLPIKHSVYVQQVTSRLLLPIADNVLEKSTCESWK